MKVRSLATVALCFVALAVACVDNPSLDLTGPSDAGDAATEDASVGPIEHPPQAAIYDFANGCVALGVETDASTEWLRPGGDGYAFEEAKVDAASKFFMKASDLGTYLFYDDDRGYLVSDDGPLVRKTSLKSDVYQVDADFVSGAEWHLEFSERRSNRFQLRHRRTDRYLGRSGLVDEPSQAVALVLEEVDGCAEYPEMSLDATGTVEPRTYDDGTLFGFVDTHSHILSSTGFGGGGIFHGQAFHRLGVEYAMGDCELFHGPEGRADLLGWGFSDNGGEELDEGMLIGVLNTGLLDEPVHATDGWPTFSDWPSQRSATHQTQYYRWLQRAWMSGLRLMVQHAVSNEVFCELMADTEFQPVRWSCEDMRNIDRQLERIHQMERYIDAQSGGPGEGWLRVVETPAQAREVIRQGKLAIVLGIEVPNLFDCYLTPRPDSPECDAEHIQSQLDHYYDLGIRALFPDHKFDNAFTPGDGDRGIVELGNFLNSAHWSNYVEDCPDVDTVFDKGRVQFGGFNKPRAEYLSPAPNELIELSTEPLRDLLPYLPEVREPALEGDWCQKAGLTDAGRTLVDGIMKRGMILELDHLPRRSYLDVFAMIEEADYPAAGTHGNTNDGKLFDLGGISKTGFRRCADPEDPGSMARGFRERRDQIEAAGGFPAIGFGFDLNGLAGVPDPRFGPDANCSTLQQNPVTHPFESYAGDVTFQQPTMGERVVDFNTEGMIHIGLVPELIEDARRTGVSDEDLDILFRSAEAYIRMWELAERRASALRDGDGG